MLGHALQMIALPFLLNPSFANHYLMMPFMGNLIALIRGGGDLKNSIKRRYMQNFEKKEEI